MSPMSVFVPSVEDAGEDAFLAGDLVKWDGTDAQKLDKIYRQKWVALFFRDHMEAWTEARRTDVPACSAKSAAHSFQMSHNL
jgi:hypothetical protein